MQTDVKLCPLHSQKPACINKGVALLVIFFNLIRMGFWPQKTASFSLFNFRSFFKKKGRKLLNFVTCTFILNVATSLAYSNKKVLKSAVKAVAISLTPAGRKERQYALWVKNQFGAHHPLNVVSVPAFSIY